MDFSKILDDWESRNQRHAAEGYEKDDPDSRPPKSMGRPEMERARIDDEIDLHGLLQEQAVGLLRHFLRESRMAGYRKVLVIHGKGLHSENRKAVLKEAVHQVLVKDKNVAAWGEAAKKDGGGGASWVWLKA